MLNIYIIQEGEPMDRRAAVQADIVLREIGGQKDVGTTAEWQARIIKSREGVAGGISGEAKIVRNL